MQRNYNYIYDKLVDDQFDIVGHIAYSLYKADKIKYIEDFKEKNGGEEPEEDALKPFHNISCLDGSIERYQLTANLILQQFLENSLQESTKEIEDKCLNDHKGMLTDVIAPLKPLTEKEKEQLLEKVVVKPLMPMSKWVQFIFGVGQSVAGALLFALLLAAIGFINLFKANDITFLIDQKGANTKHSQKEEPILPKDTINYSNGIISKPVQ